MVQITPNGSRRIVQVYELPAGSEKPEGGVIQMPVNAQLVGVQMIQQKLFVVAIVHPDLPTRSRRVAAIRTGDNVPSQGRYVATVTWVVRVMNEKGEQGVITNVAHLFDLGEGLVLTGR